MTLSSISGLRGDDAAGPGAGGLESGEAGEGEEIVD